MTPESQIPKQYTVPEFAARIRSKYPYQYKDLSDDDLAMRVLRKHPEYQSRVNLGTEQDALAGVAKAKTQFDRVAQSYMSAAGKTLNPTVTPGTDYFRPLTTTEQAAQKRGEPVIISEAGQPQTKTYDTPLTTAEERRFQEWKKTYAPKDSGLDYDLRGAYKAGLKPDSKTGHWPDTFKKPNHPTFSNQSQYAVGDNAAKAGRWEGETFVPPAPASASRPRLATALPVSLAPVIQSRLEQIQTEKRRRELQAKVEQARQVRQKVPKGLILPPGQRNQGAAYRPKFGLGETYKEVPKIDKSVPQVADYLVPERRALTFAEDRAQRERVKQQMTRLEGRAGAASDFKGEEYQNFLRLNRALDSPKMREDFLTLKAKQQIEKHGSIAGALLAQDEEAARQQRIAQMGTGEYLVQIPKSAVTGLAAGAGTTLKGLATTSKALVDQVIDTGGLETKDTDVYRLGEYITQKSKELVHSNPDLEQEFGVGKAPDTIGQSVMFLLGGWASKSPKVAVTILGAGMTAGDAYDEVRAHGGSEDQAVNAGLLAGALLGPTELIGMRGAMKAIEGTVAETTLKAALKTALREGRRDVIENALQEVGQEAAQGLITGNPRTLNQLAEAGILGAIGGLQTIPTSLGASAIETARTRRSEVVDNYIRQSPLSTPEEIAEVESSTAPIVESTEVKPISPAQMPDVVEQASATDQKPEGRAEKPSLSAPVVEKPQQIALDQPAEGRAVETKLPELPVTPAVTTPAEVKTQPSATESQVTTERKVTDEVGAEVTGRVPAPIAEKEVSIESKKSATKPAIKPSKLATGVEAKAIEAKLTAGFQGLPEYETVKVADQARMAADLLRDDPEQAKRIALGQTVPEDSKLLPESVFIAVENDALQRGDVDLLRELATASILSTEATGMGQRIRMLAERNPYSPVIAIKEIQTAREKRAKQKMGSKAKEKVITEIKTEVRTKAPKAKDWRQFLEEVRCR